MIERLRQHLRERRSEMPPKKVYRVEELINKVFNTGGGEIVVYPTQGVRKAAHKYMLTVNLVYASDLPNGRRIQFTEENVHSELISDLYEDPEDVALRSILTACERAKQFTEKSPQIVKFRDPLDPENEEHREWLEEIRIRGLEPYKQPRKH